MAKGWRLDWTDKEIRRAVRKGTRAGLSAVGTEFRKAHRQELGNKRRSRPGQAPGKRTGALQKMPRKQVRSVRGSLRLTVGFLPGKSSREEQIKAMALTHGGERKGSRGGRLDARPSIDPVWESGKNKAVATVIAAIRSQVGD